jgi:hypothetical protein
MNKPISSGSRADQVMGESSGLFDEYSGLRTQAIDRPVDVIQSTQSVDNLGFHGTTSPNLEIKTEKAAHRIIVYLKAQGYTNKEIAKATGYTEGWLSQITRQAWFKQRLASELREAGLDPVKQFLSSEALPSLEALSSVRDSLASPPAARVAAANSILDRAFGKPTVHVESKSTVNVTNAKQSADQIAEELKSIDEQLRSRGHGPVSATN